MLSNSPLLFDHSGRWSEDPELRSQKISVHLSPSHEQHEMPWDLAVGSVLATNLKLYSFSVSLQAEGSRQVFLEWPNTELDTWPATRSVDTNQLGQGNSISSSVQREDQVTWRLRPLACSNFLHSIIIFSLIFQVSFVWGYAIEKSVLPTVGCVSACCVSVCPCLNRCKMYPWPWSPSSSTYSVIFIRCLGTEWMVHWGAK